MSFIGSTFNVIIVVSHIPNTVSHTMIHVVSKPTLLPAMYSIHKWPFNTLTLPKTSPLQLLTTSASIPFSSFVLHTTTVSPVFTVTDTVSTSGRTVNIVVKVSHNPLILSHTIIQLVSLPTVLIGVIYFIQLSIMVMVPIIPFTGHEVIV